MFFTGLFATWMLIHGFGLISVVLVRLTERTNYRGLAQLAVVVSLLAISGCAMFLIMTSNPLWLLSGFCVPLVVLGSVIELGKNEQLKAF